jgi:protoporphyrinogen oxidase
MTASQQIAIIGAGVAGLSAAYDLTRSGYQVTLFEAGSEVGGLAAGFKAPHWDWPLERFYHHIFSNDTDILGLVEEIGMKDHVLFRRPLTSMWHAGTPYPFDSPLRVLTFPHLGLVDKLRMGLVIAYLRYVTKNWRGLEAHLADEWLARTMGQNAYGKLWRPMLQGKFGEHFADVNLAWFWARMVKRTPRLGYFVGGFQAFCRPAGRGGTGRRRSPVVEYAGAADRADSGRASTAALGWANSGVRLGDRNRAPGLLARMAPALDAEYLAGLRALKSMGAVVMTLAVDRQVTDGHYWINLPKGAGFPFLAFVEHTNYMDAEHYGGDHLLYCGDYLNPEHPYFSMSDEELLGYFPARHPAVVPGLPARVDPWGVGA